MLSIFSPPLEGETLLVHGCLRRAVAEYGPNPAVPRIMRHLLAQRPQAFIHASLHLLRNAPEGPGLDFLIGLLIDSQEAIRCVTDPNSVSRPETIEVVRRFMQTDQLVDIRLAHCLPGRDGHSRGLSVSASIRVLDALDELSPGSRLIPVLGYLTRYPDPRLAGKATKLVARRVANPDWIRSHMTVQDARTRANLVEALWGIDATYTRDTFYDALSDPNSRVVGNAVVGLHSVEEPGLEGCLMRMIRDPRPSFRATSAWVMGRLGEEDNVDRLKRLLHDDSTAVRGAALRALFAIRRHNEESSRQLEFLSAAVSHGAPAFEPLEAQSPEPAPPEPQPAIEAPAALDGGFFIGPRDGRRFQTRT